MIKHIAIFILTAAALMGCSTTNRAPYPQSNPCGIGDNHEICKSLYTSEFNRFVEPKFRDNNPFNFDGYVLSFDKAKAADYAEKKSSDPLSTHFSVNGDNGASINFSDAQSAPNARLKRRINKTFTTQKKNMFLTDIQSSSHVTPIDYNITSTCRNAELTDKQSYIDCSFQGLDLLEATLSRELKRKHYSHVILLSTGWHNRQPDSVRHFNQLFVNLNGSSRALGDDTFKPLYIGITWPSDWNIKYVSYLNKAADADEMGLIWANYLINKTIPSAIETSSATTKPKFVAIGHSFGARVVGTAANSKRYITSAKPNSNLPLLVLNQPAFSRTRLATGQELGERAHFNFYADIDKNVDKTIITASRRDNFFGNGIAFWSGGGTGHAGTKGSYEETCALVRGGTPNWGERYSCYQQNQIIDEDWASLLDEKPLLYLRLDSKVKGEPYEKGNDIITGHNGVKGRRFARALYDMIK